MNAQLWRRGLFGSLRGSLVNCNYSTAATRLDTLKSLNPVHRFITSKIETTGPITVAEYMKICSTGYYTGESAKNAGLLGEKGDFLTSPEISQMFGEMLGLWIITEALNLGYSGPWRLIELGPGSGTLCKDVLGILKKFKKNNDLIVNLVELSDNLARTQKKLICVEDGNHTIQSKSLCYLHGLSEDGVQIEWYRHLDDVPQGYCVILAHEFFDALPVHQFKRDEKERWREVFVDLDSSTYKLRLAMPRAESVALKAFLPEDILKSDRKCFEVCPSGGALVETIASRINQDGGVAVIMDYGHTGDRQESLRAYSKHKEVDILSNPGQSDVTADVNFSYLTDRIQESVAVFGPVTQKLFLENLGIEFRLKQLIHSTTDRKTIDYLNESYRWLTSPDQMGTKFKVMSIFPMVVKERLKELRRPHGFIDTKN